MMFNHLLMCGFKWHTTTCQAKPLAALPKRLWQRPFQGIRELGVICAVSRDDLSFAFQPATDEHPVWVAPTRRTVPLTLLPLRIEPNPQYGVADLGLGDAVLCQVLLNPKLENAGHQ